MHPVPRAAPGDERLSDAADAAPPDDAHVLAQQQRAQVGPVAGRLLLGEEGVVADEGVLESGRGGDSLSRVFDSVQGWLCRILTASASESASFLGRIQFFHTVNSKEQILRKRARESHPWRPTAASGRRPRPPPHFSERRNADSSSFWLSDFDLCRSSPPSRNSWAPTASSATSPFPPPPSSRGARRSKLSNVWAFVQLIFGPGCST